MSDALLAASILLRGVNSTLNAAIRADGPTAARLAALHSAARSVPSPGAHASSAAPSLCFVSTNPLSQGVDRLSLVLTEAGVDLHLQDPLPARATVRAANSSLLALLRAPELLADQARFQVDGDPGFALDVLQTLRGLRPDLLLPLSELVGSGLPSALHTLRAAAGGALRGVLNALRPSSTRHDQAPIPRPGPEQSPGPGQGPGPPPSQHGAAPAAPATTPVDDSNGAH